MRKRDFSAFAIDIIYLQQDVWLTPDPLGFADGPNLYAYVHNNPLNYVDPYGLSSRGYIDAGKNGGKEVWQGYSHPINTGSRLGGV